MNKCEKCGVTLPDDCVVVWKCSECGKAFKLSLMKLRKIQELKKQNASKHLLKCSSCGYPLDDADEKIICKCSSCGNVSGGNLEYFTSQNINADNIRKANSENQEMNLIECPECGKKIQSNSKICSYCGYPLKEKETLIKSPKDDAERMPKRQNRIAPKYKKRVSLFMFMIFIGVTILVNIISKLNANNDFQETKKSYEETDNQLFQEDITNNVEDDEEKNISVVHEESRSPASKSIEHYCEADGCLNEGIKAIIGLNGRTEYYCSNHYQEMQDIISMMEEDVGSGAYSKHQCEECSREGTREIIGLSGATEYYCTEHYNDIVEVVNKMTESQSMSSTSFTNKTGTSTTKCAHSGCNNYIASSGDTYYCKTHSKRCGVCGCYIDEDAMFCPTCIVDAFTQ